MHDKELVKLRRSVMGKVRAKDVSHLPEEELHALLQNDIYTTSEMAVIAGFFKEKDESYRQWVELTSGLEKPINKLFFTDLGLKVMPVVIKLIENHTFEGDFDEYMIAQACQGVTHRDIAEVIENYLITNTSYHMQQLLDRYQRLKLIITLSDAIDDLARREQIPAVVDTTIDGMRNWAKCDVEMITSDIETVSETMEKMTGSVEDVETIQLRRMPRFSEMVLLQRKEMHLIGAPAANGKTAFVMQLMDELVEDHGLTIDAFLFETSWAQYQQRYTSRNYHINGDKFRTKRHTLTVEDKRVCHSVVQKLMDYEGKVNLAPQDHEYTPALVEKIIRQRINKTGNPCDVIIIDHIDCMSPDGRTKDGYTDNNNILKSLIRIARQNNAILIVASQLNEDVVKNYFNKQSKKMPGQGCFRYGNIYNYSKLAIILYKLEEDMSDFRKPVVDQKIIICKNNNGASGVINSLYVKPTTLTIESFYEEHLVKHKDTLKKFNFHL